MAIAEANALLWEGELDRAIAFIDRCGPRRELGLAGALLTIVELECLVFDERIDEARALFPANADVLHALVVGRADVEALPIPLLLVFLEGRRHDRFDAGPFPFEIFVGLWLFAVVTRLVRSVARGGLARTVSCAAIFAVTYEADRRRRVDMVFDEADHTQAAEAMLIDERPAVTDLYFIGAAAWAGQDVFANELQSARRLFDDKSDTDGRSIILSNQESRDGALPLMASATFITSHGSDKGLAVDPPRMSAFSAETLTPPDLRSMLDAARIKWRVLVISGCESGVFIDALRNDRGAPVAAADRRGDRDQGEASRARGALGDAVEVTTSSRRFPSSRSGGPPSRRGARRPSRRSSRRC